jgi:predicted MFS family arabinose efflux permease
MATISIGVFVALIIIAAQTLMQDRRPGRVTCSLLSVLSLAQVAGLGVAGGIAQAIRIRNPTRPLPPYGLHAAEAAT